MTTEQFYFIFEIGVVIKIDGHLMMKTINLDLILGQTKLVTQFIQLFPKRS